MKKLNFSRKTKGKPNNEEFVRGGLSRNLITYHDPKSPAAEAYRSLRTNVGFAGIDKKIKVIAFTSPQMGDGKSTTAANFAIAMAKTDKKVVIVEGDLRKPKVHKYFGIGNDIGLTHILTDMIIEKQPVESFVKKVPDIENLYVVTGGFIPPNPTEVLGSKRMEEFIDRLKEQFDMVVIDTPPVAQLTDAALVGKKADGVILVIASGRTNIQAAQRAKQALLNVDAKIVGTVLTKIDKKSGSYYKGYYDSYYYEDTANR